MTDDATFEREKACFDHNCAQVRMLSKQMGRVPTVAVTLTGGLWFAAAQAQIDGKARFGLFLFAGFANIGLALSCFRIRDVIESYLEKIREFSPNNFSTGRPRRPTLHKFSKYSMISVYAGLMVVAAIMSFAAAFIFYWPFAEAYRWLSIFVFLLMLIALAGSILDKRPIA